MPLKIAMLANNPVTHDTRVIKTAESLVQLGHRVTVFCRCAIPPTSIPAQETKHGVHYVRLDYEYNLPRLCLAYFKQKKRYRKSMRTSRQSILLNMLSAPVTGCAMLSAALLYPFGKGLGQPKIHKKPLRWALYHIYQHQYILMQAQLVLLDAVVEHQPDIIHAHDIDTLKVAAQSAAFLKVPYIYDVHEYERNRVDRVGFLNRHFIAIDEKKYIRSAHVITVSDGIAQLLIQQYGIPKPTIIYNAPRATSKEDLSHVDVPITDIRQITQVPKNELLLVYTGLITQTRSLDLIVDALQHTNGIHLALVGPQDIHMVNQLKDTALKINKSGYVHILPAVPYAQVSHFIRTADAGIIILNSICTSYEHAMPNKLFETLFAGLPVICSNQNEMADLVSQFKCGVVIQHNSSLHIANAMKHLQENPTQYSPSQKVQEQIQAQYAWQAQEAKLNDLYTTI